MSSSQKLRPLQILMLLLAVALGLLLVYNLGRGHASKSAKPAVDMPHYGQIADFSLIDSRGEIFTQERLKNKVWLINFIFTRCPSMCPAMSLQFQLIGKSMPSGVGLLSLSVDPAYDTPEVLSAFSAKYTQDIKDWHFLTGSNDTIQAVIKSCHIGTDDDPNMHSLRFVLIDDKSQIRGYYDSTDPASVRKIKEDMSKLL